MGEGAAWTLTLVIPLVLVLGGYGLLYALFAVESDDAVGASENAAVPVVTSTVPEASHTGPSSVVPGPDTTEESVSSAAPSPSAAALSPGPPEPAPAPAAPAAEQISPGNYELELAGGSTVRCQMYSPEMGMFLACQTNNVGWTDDTGQPVNSVSIRFNPARAQGVLGDLGNITMEGTLATGGIYEMSTADGPLRIDTTDPDRIVFTGNGEEAWITRADFGPVSSPLDQLR